MRQPFTGFERRAALEVNQNEVEARGVVMGRQTGDEGSQEFTLTRTRGTADETVRTVFDEVEGVYALVANADFGAVSGGFLPGVNNLLGGGRRADAGEFGQAHQPGQTRTGDDELGVVEFCEHPRQFCDVVKVDAADNNVVDGTAFLGFIEGCGGVFVHCNNYGTRGGKLLFRVGDYDTGNFMDRLVSSSHFTCVNAAPKPEEFTSGCIAPFSQSFGINNEHESGAEQSVDALLQILEHSGGLLVVLRNPSTTRGRSALSGMRQPRGPRPLIFFSTVEKDA